jgi:hypothetical protein
MDGLRVVPQLGLIAPGQRNILLLLLEIYNAITLLAIVLAFRIDTGQTAEVGSIHEGLLEEGFRIMENFMQSNICCQPRCDYSRTPPKFNHTILSYWTL